MSSFVACKVLCLFCRIFRIPMIETAGRTVQSVETSCEILRCLRREAGNTVSSIADELALSPGCVHTHLATLKQYGYVVQEGDQYTVGPQFLPMGEYVRNTSSLYNAAKDEVDDLVDRTGEAVHVIIEHHGRLYALYERFGWNAVGVTFHREKRQTALRHLHCTAAGKAILAHVPEEQFVAIINESGLPEMTEQTITKIDALVEELETVRERGVAFADEEQIEGLRAAGVPVHDPDGSVLGAIALSGPVSRLKEARFREDVPEMLLDAAQVAELTIQTEELGIPV